MAVISDPRCGIRNLEEIQTLATQVANLEMPANNRCLVWRQA
jgi:hypothetical protein